MWPYFGGMFSQLEYVQEKLAAQTRAEWRVTAKGSGVPFSTVKKIGYKQTPHPRSDTVAKIAAYFQQLESQARSTGNVEREAA